MSHSQSSPGDAQILLVEDNEHDVVLTREALKRSGVAVDLHHVENGEECLAFLRRQGQYAGAPTPNLILLDLNMPVMDGRELLAELVVDEERSHLPVVVLTTSVAERDISQMYRLGCNSYIQKPVDFAEFQATIRDLCTYWFGVVELPEA